MTEQKHISTQSSIKLKGEKGGITPPVFIMNRKELLKPLGKLCKDARESYNTSVNKVADMLNVSRNAVYRFERGDYDTATFLLFYVYYFNIKLDYRIVAYLNMEAEND